MLEYSTIGYGMKKTSVILLSENEACHGGVGQGCKSGVQGCMIIRNGNGVGYGVGWRCQRSKDGGGSCL